MSDAKNPRVRRVLETALDCDDLPRSAAFYTALLAATPMVAMDRLVAIDAGEGTVLLLFPAGPDILRSPSTGPSCSPGRRGSPSSESASRAV